MCLHCAYVGYIRSLLLEIILHVIYASDSYQTHTYYCLIPYATYTQMTLKQIYSQFLITTLITLDKVLLH